MCRDGNFVILGAAPVYNFVHVISGALSGAPHTLSRKRVQLGVDIGREIGQNESISIQVLKHSRLRLLLAPALGTKAAGTMIQRRMMAWTESQF